ncbi:MAG: 2-oxoacid:acceptor oxidoreductase family protein [Anaerococcus sp.]|nr:2-oxoacid:acceptor oxidoreductase family protein [Anaerococcus sp.]
MERRILCAGFGGQGVLAMGQMITYAGMVENLEVSWMPSYGPEMRGGAANCSVVLSDSPVGAPNIDVATDVIVMNQPSFDKFKDIVGAGGNLFINSSLIDTKGYGNDEINIYKVPVSSKAKDLGNIKMANMVMLGSFLQVTNLLKLESIIEAFTKVFGDKKKHLIPANKEALNAGMQLILDNETGDECANEGYRKTPEEFAYDEDIRSEITFEYDDNIFDSPLKTAEYALQFEQNAVDYYTYLSKNLNDSYRGIFESVAMQEVEHVDYIKALLEKLENHDDNLNQDFEAYKNIALFEDENYENDEDEMTISALKNALYIEYNELEFYKKASEKVDDKQSKELYSELVKWENDHYNQFDEHTKLHQEQWWADQSFSKL